VLFCGSEADAIPLINAIQRVLAGLSPEPEVKKQDNIVSV